VGRSERWWNGISTQHWARGVYIMLNLRTRDELQQARREFQAALALQPELLIFGSGTRLQFISPTLYRCLIERRIGVETMDTAAACRTFNVLAGEGRSVMAALIIEAPG
jgi:uncharacterized protein